MHLFHLAAIAALGCGTSVISAASLEDLDANVVQRVAVDMDLKTYASFRQVCTHTAGICPALKIVHQDRDVIKAVATMNALDEQRIANLNRKFQRVLGVDGANPFAYAVLLADTIAQLEQRLLQRIGLGDRYDDENVIEYIAQSSGGGDWFPANGYEVPAFGSRLSLRARANVKLFKAALHAAGIKGASVVDSSQFWADSLLHSIFGNLPWQDRLERLEALHQHVDLASKRPGLTKMASKILLRNSVADIIGSYLMSGSYPLNRMPPKMMINGEEQAFVMRTQAPNVGANEPFGNANGNLHFELVPYATLEEERARQQERLQAATQQPAKRFAQLHRLLGIHRQTFDEIQANSRHYRQVTNPWTQEKAILPLKHFGLLWLNFAIVAIAYHFNLDRLLMVPTEIFAFPDSVSDDMFGVAAIVAGSQVFSPLFPRTLFRAFHVLRIAFWALYLSGFTALMAVQGPSARQNLMEIQMGSIRDTIRNQIQDAAQNDANDQ